MLLGGFCFLSEHQPAPRLVALWFDPHHMVPDDAYSTPNVCGCQLCFQRARLRDDRYALAVGAVQKVARPVVHTYTFRRAAVFYPLLVTLLCTLQVVKHVGPLEMPIVVSKNGVRHTCVYFAYFVVFQVVVLCLLKV